MTPDFAELGPRAMAPLLMALALPVALALDRLLGEPPTAVHPVVGMGTLLTQGARWLPARPPRRAMVAGAAIWLAGAALVVALATLAQGALLRVVAAGLASGLDSAPCAPWQGLAAAAWAALVMAILLKSMLSLRMLIDEVAAVERALGSSLTAGRRQVARLCSRDTAALSEAAVREAAIESLAENLNDSVVAPLFWFAVAGLPGAALYRWANTADAAWGYRCERWAWAGRFAARADDVLSWLPARLSAWLVWRAAQPRPPCAWAALAVEARRTPSPNSGWPMAAMALRLGVRLSKPGVYLLNPSARTAQAHDVATALAIASAAAWRGLWALSGATGAMAWATLWATSWAAPWTGLSRWLTP